MKTQSWQLFIRKIVVKFKINQRQTNINFHFIRYLCKIFKKLQIKVNRFKVILKNLFVHSYCNILKVINNNYDFLVIKLIKCIK